MGEGTGRPRLASLLALVEPLSWAHRLVNDLLEEGAVLPVPEERLLVHEPGAKAFESILQLAVFHRGWAAHDRDEGC